MEEEGEEEETNGGERTLVRWGVLPGRYLRKKYSFVASFFRDDLFKFCIVFWERRSFESMTL